MNENLELYKKYRPTSFKQIVGQPEAVRTLVTMLTKNTFPHTLLISGSSGVGKTTIARILKDKLHCGDSDYHEINAASSRGIDTIREIQQVMHLAPISGHCRIWYLDEVHSLTKDAQNSALKILEDSPDHVYFFLATTDPNRLLKTIVTRCTHIRLSLLSQKILISLAEWVLNQENITVDMDVIESVVEASDGSARKCLVLLHQILGLPSKEEQLKAIHKADAPKQAIQIARILLNPRSKWADLQEILVAIEDDPEGIRRLVLEYAKSVMLKDNRASDRAYLILTCFEGDFFASGSAGLVRACYEVYREKGIG